MMLSFQTRLESDAEAIFIRVPEGVVAALEHGKRVPVTVSINGFGYQSTIATYGGKFYLPVRREVREGARVSPGDDVTVTLEYDADVRTVELPEPLRAALVADPTAAAAFERMSFTHRKEFVRWISEAKREQTRQRRVAQALTMLRRRAPSARP